METFLYTIHTSAVCKIYDAYHKISSLYLLVSFLLQRNEVVSHVASLTGAWAACPSSFSQVPWISSVQVCHRVHEKLGVQAKLVALAAPVDVSGTVHLVWEGYQWF